MGKQSRSRLPKNGLWIVPSILSPRRTQSGTVTCVVTRRMWSSQKLHSNTRLCATKVGPKPQCTFTTTTSTRQTTPSFRLSVVTTSMLLVIRWRTTSPYHANVMKCPPWITHPVLPPRVFASTTTSPSMTRMFLLERMFLDNGRNTVFAFQRKSWRMELADLCPTGTHVSSTRLPLSMERGMELPVSLEIPVMSLLYNKQVETRSGKPTKPGVLWSLNL